MRLLLDTCTFLWVVGGASELSARAREAFSDPGNELAKQYRVANWPMAYVLDGKGTIQYAGSLGSFTELTADALATESP